MLPDIIRGNATAFFPGIAQRVEPALDDAGSAPDAFFRPLEDSQSLSLIQDETIYRADQPADAVSPAFLRIHFHAELFFFPELNESALSGLRDGLPAGCRSGYSNSRTCEMGLSLRSGLPYQSIAYLVDRCTAKKT